MSEEKKSTEKDKLEDILSKSGFKKMEDREYETGPSKKKPSLYSLMRDLLREDIELSPEYITFVEDVIQEDIDKAEEKLKDEKEILGQFKDYLKGKSSPEFREAAWDTAQGYLVDGLYDSGIEIIEKYSLELTDKRISDIYKFMRDHLMYAKDDICEKIIDCKSKFSDYLEKRMD